LALLGGLLAAPNARADGDIGAAVPAAPGAAERPQGTVPPAPPAAPVPPSADQAAATGQDAAADAVAAQPQQPNVVVIVRINSPGDDFVTQTNTVTVDSSSSNQSTTTQAETPAAATLLLSRPTRAAAAAAPQQPAKSAPAGVANAARAPNAAATPAAAPERAAAPAQRRATAPRSAPQRARTVSVAAPRPSHQTRPSVRHSPAASPSPPTPGPAGRAARIARGGLLALTEPLRDLEAPVAPVDVSSSDEPGFALAALAALATGLLGWAAVVWLPRRRSALWSSRG
jgi:hypothetical protein